MSTLDKCRQKGSSQMPASANDNNTSHSLFFPFDASHNSLESGRFRMSMFRVRWRDTPEIRRVSSPNQSYEIGLLESDRANGWWRSGYFVSMDAFRASRLSSPR